MVGSRTDIVVAMDWTDYDADGQATLTLKLVTRHGRVRCCVWLSVHKDELTDARNAYEDAALRRLAEVLPAGVKCTILADRGFADTKLFGLSPRWTWATSSGSRAIPRSAQPTGRPGRRPGGSARTAGRARLRDARVTETQCPVGAAVCVHAKGMKEPWCLVASDAVASSPADHRPLREEVERGAQLP